MPQGDIWEKEYQNPKLIAGGDEPQKDALKFFRFLKKEEGWELNGLSVLDLGSGLGRNSNYLANLGNNVVGLEAAPSALREAKNRAENFGVKVDYRLADIGRPYSFSEERFDLILDVLSSNSLDEEGRAVYLKEVFRVMKKGSWLFVKTLAKEGDKNAQMLLKNSPGPEMDTYILKGLGLTERVFSEKDFCRLYENFEIKKLFKKTNYTRFNNQSYKRNFWLAYLRKS